MTRTLLVIDDDVVSTRLLNAIFAREGVEVTAAHDAATGLVRVAAAEPDILCLDLGLPDLPGIEVLERLRASNPELPVIILTANAEVRTAVRATQLGAFDYLTKPIDPDELVVVVRRALERRALQAEVADLRRQVGEGGGLAVQMGSSLAMREILEQVRTVAASTFTVLVLGETGTGKELVAQAIHRQSERRARPYIAVDCGAIPETLLESELFGHEKGAFSGAERKKEGRFHLAEGGTLFLDEIGNLPLGLQAKLLRVLESRQVQAIGATRTRPLDVRFVAATNVDLQRRVHEGTFRADLYFRLAQYTITLPRLRDRPADVPYLAARFVEEASIELRKPVQGLDPEAVELLQQQAWPGNVRELRNLVRQAVLTTKELVVQAADLRPLLGQPAPVVALRASEVAGRSLKQIADEAAREAERQAIQAVLRATGGNKSQAAKTLRTDYKTLHLKMKQLGIRARDFGP
ncbi:MAG TPA: sigma-54 dependent transcriptional regulator [Kofleriaceae bacterium]|nr:sigma-54 dependent transcriptional regulator [Kofleriaceae bacterium]